VFADSSWILRIGLPVMTGYSVLASLIAILIARLRRAPEGFWDRLALVNVLGVPFCFAALYAVSRSTQVTIQASGDVREYSWLPAWLAVGGTAALLVWAMSGIVRAHRAADVRAHERLLVLTVAAPVALLLFLAALPGVLGGIDIFHEGEPLAGARLAEEGAFPWRDLVLIHGFLEDIVFPEISFTQFEHSRWGWAAGGLVLVIPFCWISIYYLCAYLFHRNWIFLVGTQVAVVLGVIFEIHTRFILLPIALLLLAALLSKPSPARAAGFTAAVFVQAIVTPEAGLLAVALLATVVLFELCYYQRSRPLVENLRRTLLCAASGVVLSILFAAFLASVGALDDFIFSYSSFASNHELTGALPINWVSDRYRFDAIAPVVLVVLAIWYFGIQLLRGRALSVADWTMGGLAMVVALYYHKFLARSDLPHLYQSFAPAVVLVFFVVYRLISLAENEAAQLRPRLAPLTRLGVTVLALGVLVIAAPLSLANVVSDLPRRLHATAPADANVPEAGFTSFDYKDVVRDLNRVIDLYAGPHAAVYDFSNSPALFYFLLDRPSPTPYYHIALAARADDQDAIIKDLAQTRPRLVVFSSSGFGLPWWDGISNQVRHYRVSRYLLDNYKPLVKWRGFVFMGLKGESYPPASSIAAKVNGGLTTRGLYSKMQPCDWGYAPNFFAEEPSAASLANPLPLKVSRLAAMRGWAIDPKARRPAAAVLVAIGDKVVARFAPTFRRPDIVAHFRSRDYSRAGFDVGRISLPLSSGESLWRVRLYGLSHDGRAGELGYGADAPPSLRPGRGPRTLDLNGRRIPVVGGAAVGYLDSATFPDHLLHIDVPRGTDLSRYHWLEIQAASPLHKNSFVFTDLTSNIDHGVQFKTLGRGATRVRVDVGACSQWYGYPTRLSMYSSTAEAYKAVRLYR
jgi:hypothetical protein